MIVTNNHYRAAALVFVTGLLFVPMASGSLWWREAIDSGHTIIFCIISFFIHYQLSIRGHFSNKAIIYFIAFVVAMLLGVIIEILQGLTYREASLSDIVSNFLGIAAGLCLAAAFHQKNKHCRRSVSLYLATGCCLLLMGVYPLIQLSWYYVERAKAFPAITAFDEQWSSSFTRFNKSEIVSGPGVKQSDHTGLYLARFYQGKYPGISVVETVPDWSKYRNLRLSIFSRSEKSIVMVLRIHDKTHNQEHADRFNKRLHIKQGLNKFEIPLNQIKRGPLVRELDLTNIAGVILFFSDLTDELEIELSNIYLE